MDTTIVPFVAGGGPLQPNDNNSGGGGRGSGGGRGRGGRGGGESRKALPKCPRCQNKAHGGRCWEPCEQCAVRHNLTKDCPPRTGSASQSTVRGGGSGFGFVARGAFGGGRGGFGGGVGQGGYGSFVGGSRPGPQQVTYAQNVTQGFTFEQALQIAALMKANNVAPGATRGVTSDARNRVTKASGNQGGGHVLEDGPYAGMTRAQKRAIKARERVAEQAASAVSRAGESSATPQDDPNKASDVNPPAPEGDALAASTSADTNMDDARYDVDLGFASDEAQTPARQQDQQQGGELLEGGSYIPPHKQHPPPSFPERRRK